MWSNKAEGACHSNEPPGPHPWPSFRHQKTHTCHTLTHAQKKKKTHKWSNALLTTSSKQTNPNLQQWHNWCRTDCVDSGCCLCSFFKSCVAFHVFYVWHKLFLSIFLHKSDISSMLQVISVCWESRLQALWGAESSLAGDSSSPRLKRANGGPRSLTSTLKPPQTEFWIGKSLWGIFTREQSEGCSSWRPGLALKPWIHTHTVLVPLHHTQLAQSKHKEERKKNSNHGFWWSTRSVKQNTVNYLLKHRQILPFFSSILHFYSIQMEVTEEIMVVKTKPTSYYYRLYRVNKTQKSKTSFLRITERGYNQGKRFIPSKTPEQVNCFRGDHDSMSKQQTV